MTTEEKAAIAARVSAPCFAAHFSRFYDFDRKLRTAETQRTHREFINRKVERERKRKRL